jgi:predicted dehydrogenase/threonine dehydrogenase-like Zn-dependent dehydrogenase
MKQIIQELKSGRTVLAEVPAPCARPGCVLVRTSRSLVSLGTERMLVEFGRAGLIDKARQQPEKVRQALDKIKTDGLLPTLDAVFRKLNQPLPLGYCNAGRVIAVGAGVDGFRVGDRVASNGPHAEIVCVPVNLAARIPDGVSDEQAAFTVIGAVGLQGVRLIAPTFGETVVVVGLGLVGLVSAQLLAAHGCRVIGVDLDPGKLDLAARHGALPVAPGQDPVQAVLAATGGLGCDAVLVAASSPSDEIMHQAAAMARKRGRIVLVGVVGLNLRRADFYEKELTFQVSCSYGPGRYDEAYEQKGRDYPPGYVRWTEKRNFEAILQALADRRLDVAPLITERVPLEGYETVYGDMRKRGSIASILSYPETDAPPERLVRLRPAAGASTGVVGLIGAGQFADSTLVPCLAKAGLRLKTVVSAGGLSAALQGRKGGFECAATEAKAVWEDPAIDLVVIATRHNLHAGLVCEALAAGKHVFVEKPLCLNRAEFDRIRAAAEAASANGRYLLVGFNRRFAPLSLKAKALLGGGPMSIVATMNAGAIPAGHWVHDPEVGGGRIIGEACHLIDLCRDWAGSPVTAVCMNALGPDARENTDNATILLRMANGSQAVVNYFANGSKAYPKERIEAFSKERTLVVENWRKLAGYGFKGFSAASSGLDKGHAEQFRRVAQWLRAGGLPPLSLEDVLNSTDASLAAVESLKTGRWVEVSDQ